MKSRSLAGLVLAVLFASLPALADGRGFELGLLGGYGLARASVSSAYSAEWIAYELESLRADTRISAKSGNALDLGISLAYFFMPNLGLQVSGGYFDPELATNADFLFQWKLKGQPAVEDSRAWPGSGRLRTSPLSLDVVGRFSLGPVALSASGGATLFLNSFDASSFAGLGASFVDLWWVWIDQYVDAFQIPLRIERTSWSALGGNLGLSLDVRIAGPMSLTLDGRYFLCPSKDFAWTWRAGTYTGLNNPQGYFSEWEFSDSDLAESQAATTRLRINPSFWAVTAGLKIRI